MRFGIWTPIPHVMRPDARMEAAIRESGTRGVFDGPDKGFRYAVEVLARGEELGFETTLLAERWLGPDHSAWMLAAAVAARTSKMELMVAAHPGIMAPAAFAKMAASLDRISGGRAALNIVNGWWKEEFEVFSGGAPMLEGDARYRQMEEFLQVMHGMWGDGRFTFDGEHYKIDSPTIPLKPVQVPNPPIYAASRNDIGKEIVARYCDHWFVDYITDYRSWEKNVDLVGEQIADMQARASRHGRKLGYGMSCHVICEKSHEAAVEKAHELEAYGNASSLAFRSSKSLGPGLLGTPETIVDRIQRFEKAGVTTILLQFHPMMEGMEHFAREILPLLDKKRAA